MIRQLWLNAVKSAWKSYIKKIERCSTEKRFSEYLKQRLDMDMTLEEFAEMVFIEGFTAGEHYARKIPLPKGAGKVRMN
ncbi:hypothetical protein E0L29_01015 [Chlorobium sp. N1]|nr:hypothetical protein E0L29_01015 [Chlorobium sp. N1]